MNYYGIDWLAMLLTVLAIYLLGNKARYGFVLMTLGNVCWVTMGVLTDSMAMILANLIFLTMNVRGWFKWAPEGTSVSIRMPKIIRYVCASRLEKRGITPAQSDIVVSWSRQWLQLSRIEQGMFDGVDGEGICIHCIIYCIPNCVYTPPPPRAAKLGDKMATLSPRESFWSSFMKELYPETPLQTLIWQPLRAISQPLAS